MKVTDNSRTGLHLIERVTDLLFVILTLNCNTKLSCMYSHEGVNTVYLEINYFTWFE